MATKPLGGERYPFGVRELSLVMSTDIDGHTSLRFIYWNAKQLDQMIGRVSRIDLENKVIFDVGTELRSWADATVIHPAIGCTMTKSKVATGKFELDVHIRHRSCFRQF